MCLMIIDKLKNIIIILIVNSNILKICSKNFKIKLNNNNCSSLSSSVS